MIRTIALAGVVTIVVAGCGIVEVPLLGPLAIRGGDEGFEVAVCEAISARGFSMSERKSDDSEWIYFWEADQRVDIRDGDILSPSRGSDFGLPDGSEPAMAPGSAVDIFILDQSGDGADTISAAFHVPDEGLPTLQWLHPDGSVSDEACGDD